MMITRNCWLNTSFAVKVAWTLAFVVIDGIVSVLHSKMDNSNDKAASEVRHGDAAVTERLDDIRSDSAVTERANDIRYGLAVAACGLSSVISLQDRRGRRDPRR